MDEWIRYGFVPSPLAYIAAKAEYEDYKPADLRDDEKTQMAELRDWAVSQILEPKATLEQIRGAPTGEDPPWPLPKGTMPREDRDNLWLIARQQLLPAMTETDLILRYGRTGPVGEMAPFRGGSNGARVPRNVPPAGKGPSRGRRGG